MNYTKTKTINSLTGRSLILDSSHNLYFQISTKKNEYLIVKIDINNLGNLVKIQTSSKSEQQVIAVSEHFLVTNDIRGFSYIYNKDNLQFLYSPLEFGITEANSLFKEWVNGYRYINKINHQHIYDLQNRKEKWSHPGGGLIKHFDNNTVILQEWEIKKEIYKPYFDYLNLSAYDINDNKKKWTIDLTKFGNFDRFNTTIHSHLLEFIMTSEDSFIIRIKPFDLIAIDRHTGKILWQNTTLNNSYGATKLAGSQLNQLMLLKKEQKIIKLNTVNVYLEFDIQQQAISRIVDNMDSSIIFTGAQLMQNEDLILFIGAEHGVANVFGFFSRSQLKIIWKHNLATGISTMPVVIKNKIFARDNMNTLHIFERTD